MTWFIERDRQAMEALWSRLPADRRAADPCFVGHRLGDVSRYPTDLGALPAFDREGDPRSETAILLDEGFGPLDETLLDGLEVDVQVRASDPDERVYVSHDAIPGDADPDYMDRNTLLGLLAGHVPHAVEGRRLFVELKGGDPRLIDAVHATILSAKEDLDLSDAEHAAILTSVGFASFSLDALRTSMDVGLDPALQKHYLIATTNQLVLGAGVGVARLPRLSTTLRHELATEERLAGVWFDPSFIRDPAETFHAINAGRAERGSDPLELFVSTYHRVPVPGICDTMEEKVDLLLAGPPVRVHGMIFELVSPTSASG